MASKTVAMFKSPHSGNLGESHAGGRSATALRLSGFGAIVIKGKSSLPVYLVIKDGKVYFRDASALWGMRNLFTVSRIIRENETDSGFRTIMCIGRGGERLVSYACVTTETYRHFGRLGLGAVWGSKNLKALVISGQSTLQVKDKKLYRDLYNQIYKEATTTPAMRKYHHLGTSENVLNLNKIKALPTKNLKSTTFEYAHKISGERLAQDFLGKRYACSHCPIGCIHIAALREPYEDEPYFYKTFMVSYDYEPIYSLASMLGIQEAEEYLKLMDYVEILGLDAISSGVILAWATEAQEKGSLSRKETEGIELHWGDRKAYQKVLDFIVEQPNEFYCALAKGVDYVSSMYGGEEFALAFGHNEMPGYHTGPAAHIGFAIGARHSHLDNAGYSIDQKVLVKGKLTPSELVEKLLEEEAIRQILSSLVICFLLEKFIK